MQGGEKSEEGAERRGTERGSNIAFHTSASNYGCFQGGCSAFVYITCFKCRSILKSSADES